MKDGMKRRLKKYAIFDGAGLHSRDTHILPPYKRLYDFAMHKWIVEKNVVTPTVIDPFARKCMWGTHRNDANSLFFQNGFTTHCMDALEFLTTMETNSAHIILLDPPFSDRQAAEEYGSNNLYANPGYMVEIGLQCFRVLRPKGYLIKAGYNTNPPFKGFGLEAVRICNLGAHKNDILFSLWQNQQMDWSDYI